MVNFMIVTEHVVLQKCFTPLTWPKDEDDKEFLKSTAAAIISLGKRQKSVEIDVQSY